MNDDQSPIGTRKTWIWALFALTWASLLFYIAIFAGSITALAKKRFTQ